MENLNIPNLLTLFRILLIPLFGYYFLIGEYQLALILFAIAGLTDLLDGALARWMKAKTALGAILDPAADKLLMLVAFIVLALRGVVPSWLTLLVIGRDLYITSGTLILKILKIKFSIQPTRLSKFNTFLQLATIVYAFLLTYLRHEAVDVDPSIYETLHHFRWTIFYGVGCMTVITGIQYTIRGIKIFKSR